MFYLMQKNIAVLCAVMAMLISASVASAAGVTGVAGVTDATAGPTQSLKLDRDFDRFIAWFGGEWNNNEQVWQQKTDAEKLPEHLPRQAVNVYNLIPRVLPRSSHTQSCA